MNDILCIDKKIRGKWQKDWLSLYPGIKVISTSDWFSRLGDNSLSSPLLCFVHMSVLSDLEFRKVKRVVKVLPDYTFLMFVNAGGEFIETFDHINVHFSRIPFPNGTSLDYLSKPVERLVLSLDKFVEDQCHKDSNHEQEFIWGEWENLSNPVKVSLSPGGSEKGKTGFFPQDCENLENIEKPGMPVFIIGEGEVPLMIKLLMNQLHWESKFYNMPPGDLTKEETCSKDFIKECAIVVVVFKEKVHSIEILNFLHFLREDLQWEGSFLAVVSNQEEGDRLEGFDLLGKNPPVYPFGKIYGHSVLVWPFEADVFIREIGQAEVMYRDQWHEIQQENVIHVLIKEMKQVMSCLRENNHYHALVAIKEILAIANRVDLFSWDIFLKEHRYMSKVKEFYAKYRDREVIEVADIVDIIDSLRDIVEFTYFGGINWNL